MLCFHRLPMYLDRRKKKKMSPLSKWLTAVYIVFCYEKIFVGDTETDTESLGRREGKIE